jgi:hypothetical protein
MTADAYQAWDANDVLPADTAFQHQFIEKGIDGMVRNTSLSYLIPVLIFLLTTGKLRERTVVLQLHDRRARLIFMQIQTDPIRPNRWHLELRL